MVVLGPSWGDSYYISPPDIDCLRPPVEAKTYSARWSDKTALVRSLLAKLRSDGLS